MVTQFLGLKLQLLANLFRRSPWRIVGIAIGLLYGLALAIGIVIVLVGLRQVNDVEVVRDGMIVAGSLVVLGFMLVPLVFGVDDTMDPRAFAVLGIPNRQLSLGLAVSALIGVPSVVLTIVLLGTVVTWSRGVIETLLALISAALLLATCVLAARVSTSIAAFLLTTRRSREVTGIIGVLALVMISPVVVLLINVDWARDGLDVLGGIARNLGWTPLGAAWAVPGDAAAGAWGPAFLKLLIAVATVYLLWLAWQALVGKMLVTPGRETPVKHYGGLGWFDRMPPTPLGAIAARSLTYWARDSRYWASLVMIPVVPVLAVVPLSIAGVPGGDLALLPVPMMCLFLGWATHNDVAFDSTAVWLHTASGTRGFADRVGRLIPVLLVGIPLIGLGSAVSIYLYGDWAALPSMLGVSTSLLLTGLGVASFTSARYPYPATRPGDSPFTQPQASDTASALIQSLTFAGAIALSLPSIILGLQGVFSDASRHMPALYWGLGVGLGTLVVGVWLGSRTFERRGPEILASALRA